jgi:glycosyltransferase involved in cell wall biosynthesis
MKVGVLTICYNEEATIGACINQFKRFQMPHLVLISSEPWHGDSFEPDQTNDIATSLGAEVICGNWTSEASQRNFGLNYFKDYDWVLIVDADEFYTGASLRELSASLETTADAVVAQTMYVYWKTQDYRIEPVQEDNPIVAIRPNQRFAHARQAFCSTVDTKAILHHLSYVRDDINMWKKISSFEHAVDFDIQDWYERVWLDWSPDRINLHPVNPSQFHRTVRRPLPKELKELFLV